MRQYDKLYVGGEWIESASSNEMTLVNPTTEEAFASLVLGNREDVDKAVAAARQAFPAFSRTTKAERIDLFKRIIASYEKRRADLRDAMAEEMGCPVGTAVQTDGALDHFKEAIRVLETYEFEGSLGSTIIRREPIGVCGLISPWNWPVQTPCVKLSAALAAGCTVVLKPSEYSTTSVIVLAEILNEAGLPRGVFNLVPGDGPGVGHALCAHEDVDAISFTGSTRAGTLVAAAAAPTIKRVTQELGGKSANVILPDADLAAAARWNVTRAFFNSGQSCHAPSRILVHESQAPELIGHLVSEAAKMRIGDPHDPAVTMGPVVNKAQFDRIQSYIQIGLDEDARLACGGVGRPDGFARGFFVKPTVFTDVSPSARIAQEEIFGPVLAVLTYSSLQEAIDIANGTPYGLGGYLFTSSPEKAREVGNALRAGRIFLNGAPGNPSSPMGGYKQSGNGREMGRFGLEEYLEVKSMFGFAAA